MDLTDYLDASPLDLIKYSEHSAMDAVAFIGTARKHPYDAEKCLLLASKQDNENGFKKVLSLNFGWTTLSEQTNCPLWWTNRVTPVNSCAFGFAEVPLGSNTNPLKLGSNLRTMKIRNNCAENSNVSIVLCAKHQRLKWHKGYGKRRILGPSRQWKNSVSTLPTCMRPGIGAIGQLFSKEK